MPNYLNQILNTNDYPERVDILREQFDIEIYHEDICMNMSNGDSNVSNAYVHLVFDDLTKQFNKMGTFNTSYITNNMDSHFYVNGDEITCKDDIPTNGTVITVNAIEYSITGTPTDYNIEQINGEGDFIEMIEDITGEYWEFYINSEFIEQSPHMNTFDNDIECIRWFITTQE